MAHSGKKILALPLGIFHQFILKTVLGVQEMCRYKLFFCGFQRNLKHSNCLFQLNHVINFYFFFFDFIIFFGIYYRAICLIVLQSSFCIILTSQRVSKYFLISSFTLDSHLPLDFPVVSCYMVLIFSSFRMT